MTIDEAITDLSIQLEVKRQLRKDYQADAIRLGIEALKAVKAKRKGPYVVKKYRLPGETEE